MGKKAAAKHLPARKTGKPARITEAEAISQLANAINALATAVATQKSIQPVSTVQLESQPFVEARPRRAAPLSTEQILDGIRHIFSAPRLALDTDINAVIEGGPARLVAMWEKIDDWPAFRERGLMIGPNDLRYVSTVAQLVGVIAWGLKNALHR